MRRIINGICMILGLICIGLGIVGIALPILPTTPLFLAAACLFAKGSERFNRWFLGTKLYKRYIEQAFINRSMDRRSKRRMLVTLALVFGIGIYFSPLFAKIIILIVAAAHFYFLSFRVRTVERTGVQTMNSEQVDG